MQKNYLFFDNASTTKCCEPAIQEIVRYSSEFYGNPSSSHDFGQKSALAIKESRKYFADIFNVEAEQIIFTGSGSESDNLAIYGTVLSKHLKNKNCHVLVSNTEHPAVLKAAQSLADFGVETGLVPVDKTGGISFETIKTQLKLNTLLVSIHRVNNITGAVFPIEEFAKEVKTTNDEILFHSDCVQAFGRISVPASPSLVDLISISGHKIEGPKGIGALVVLNKKLLNRRLRPIIWGGSQEGGLRAGTSNTALITAFAAAAKYTLSRQKTFFDQTLALNQLFKSLLIEKGLHNKDAHKTTITWNSPPTPALAVPHIINISIPGLPSAPIVRLMEDNGCIVATGAACFSKKQEPDPVLTTIGLSKEVASSAIRISFSRDHSEKDVHKLADTLEQAIITVKKLGP